MRSLQSVANQEAAEIIKDLVNRRARASLTCKSARGWRMYKCSFSSGAREFNQLNLFLPLRASGESVLIPHAGTTVGVTFRLGHRKCMFAGDVLSVNDDGTGALLELAWPNRIEHLQRRAYDRSMPPRGTVIPVRFWQEDSAAPPGDGKQVGLGQLEDISAGGMQVNASDAFDIRVGGAYVCVFATSPGAHSLIIESVLRHHEETDRGRTRLGFQFVGLETTPEGRQTLDQLARLVSRFQRGAPRSNSTRRATTLAPNHKPGY